MVIEHTQDRHQGMRCTIKVSIVEDEWFHVRCSLFLVDLRHAAVTCLTLLVSYLRQQRSHGG